MKNFNASADHFCFFLLISTCQKTSMKDFQQVEFSGKQYAGDCVFPVSVGAMAVPLPVPPIAGKVPKAGTKLRKDNASQGLRLSHFFECYYLNTQNKRLGPALFFPCQRKN
jgi:hypothetical protein